MKQKEPVSIYLLILMILIIGILLIFLLDAIISFY